MIACRARAVRKPRDRPHPRQPALNIPTVIVPPLLVLHGLIVWLLLRRGRP
ncbi:MAG: hypothetical protein JSR91_10530 [Proteobacteria bacterium]|nr:hypothetical protein [Pseudomonadota bacterium]